MTTLAEDAVTRGELQFAIVHSFNSKSKPTAGRINPSGKTHYGDGSGDMTGAVRLMDGTVLPFAYVDGRFPRWGWRHWNEEGYSPAWGGYGMSWPYETAVLMVEVADNRVRRWTWPGAIMGDAYRVNDHRYLTPPDYGRAVMYPGLHCLVDRQLLPQDCVSYLASEWQRPACNFPPYAAYVGHHADSYLPFVQAPDRFVVFKWDSTIDASVYASGRIGALKCDAAGSPTAP